MQYTFEFIYEFTGVDCRNYLRDVLYFDMLTLDVDRHFSNLALIQDGGYWKTAPLFDLGASFFSLQHVFKPEMSFQEKLDIMTPQPFSLNFEEQAYLLGPCRIKLNYADITAELKKETQQLQEIVLYQLEKYERIFRA